MWAKVQYYQGYFVLLGMKTLFILAILVCIGCKNTQKDTITMKKEKFVIEKTDKEWKEQLTEEQFRVLRQKGTEYPFTGKYNDFYEKGSYYCVACGTLLFDSESKFKSGCGWPSFSNCADERHILLQKDTSHGMVRTEVLCANCGGHLGHLFEDGPVPSHLRYCINSVAVKFQKD